MRILFATTVFILCSIFTLIPMGSLASESEVIDNLSPVLVARLKLANDLYNQDNLAAALIEYRRIQVESGKTPGLFNVGRICARLNRPVEAVIEFNKLLAEPGRTPEEKLTEARRLRDEQQARIGALVVWTSVPAFIEVDNVAVGKTTVKVFVGGQETPDGKLAPDHRYTTEKPIDLANGPHLIAAIASGFAPLRLRVEISGGTTHEISPPLVPAKGELAHIRLKTPIPGATIILDGQPVGRTPIDVSLSVEAGPHELALQRTGYRTDSLRRLLTEGQTWDAEMTLEEEKSESNLQTGELELVGQAPGTAVSVNGKTHHLYSNRIRLPPGPHQIELTHSGFLPYRAEVEIESGKVRHMRIEMEATAEFRHGRLSQASGQRWRVWTTLALGGVITGGGIYFLREGRAEQKHASTEFNEVQALFKPGAECSPQGLRNEAACKAKIDRVNGDLDSADRKVLIGYIATGVGAAALVTGLVLALTLDDVHSFEQQDQSIAWFGWPLTSGGGVGVVGRF
jgi:hypothetical protein